MSTNSNATKRAGVYARVSTDGQETANQLLQMVRFVESQGWECRDFIDHQTGKTDQRPQLQALFAAAGRREIDVVVFWSLDRFTREGALDTPAPGAPRFLWRPVSEFHRAVPGLLRGMGRRDHRHPRHNRKAGATSDL